VSALGSQSQIMLLRNWSEVSWIFGQGEGHEEGTIQRRADHWHRKRHEVGQKVTDLVREHGISEGTIYTWKGKYGGMEG
jgi:hypothetical protein